MVSCEFSMFCRTKPLSPALQHLTRLAALAVRDRRGLRRNSRLQYRVHNLRSSWPVHR